MSRNDKGPSRTVGNKKVLTSQERAQAWIRKSMEQVYIEIQKGQMRVSPHSKALGGPPLKQEDPSNPLSLQSVEESLKSLRANIEQQKRQQREVEKAKLLKAHELIVKIKKEKEQHRQKIQSKEEKSILHSRIFSESTIGKMRQKLEERIFVKRKEMEERIKIIAARQSERSLKVADQQIQYWEKMKKLSEKNRQSKSVKMLPSIRNPESEERRQSIHNMARKESTDSLKVECNYGLKIDLYLQRAKQRQQHSSLKSMENKNQQRASKVILSNKRLAAKLGGQINEKNEFIPYRMNRSKIFGDQYLKDAVLKLKKSGNVDSLKSEDLLQESLELQVNEKQISRNEKVQKLKENYDRMLSRVKHNEISRQKGLEVLNSMERRLDRLDSEGLRDRLKKKYEMLESREQEEIRAESNQFLGYSD